MTTNNTSKNHRPRLPEWIKVKVQPGQNKENVDGILSDLKLNTVCREAKCPNLHECWQKRTATFMILGSQCTRNCKFCAVGHTTALLPPDVDEPENVAEAAAEMNLRYVVITSVTRDDLEDEGAGQFVKTIHAIKEKLPNAGIEVLTPDFNARPELLEQVFAAAPSVFNHNIETVRRLTPLIRSKATYERSLEVLQMARKFPRRKFMVKSGIMVGAGETDEEVEETIRDLYEHGVRMLTIGQYLPPSREHWPLDRYVEPEKFEEWKKYAEELGFRHVASGPMVRSSYMAENLFNDGNLETIMVTD